MSRVSAFFPILYFDRGYNLEYNISMGLKKKMGLGFWYFGILEF